MWTGFDLGREDAMRPAPLWSVAALVLLGCLALANPAGAQREVVAESQLGLGLTPARLPHLFADPPGAARAASPAEHRATFRARPVRVDEGLLERSVHVALNLFPDAILRAVRTDVEYRGPGRYTWHGRVEGPGPSQVTLVVENGDLAGNVRVAGRSFQIRPLGGGLHTIREIDEAAFPEDEAPLSPSASGASAIPQAAVAADDGTEIDVLVVYTPDAADASANILAEVLLAIAETNTAYSNSGVTQRLRLVGAQEVDYAGSGGMYTDLTRLQGIGDGFLDEVHPLRNAACADVVSLWVGPDPDSCGLGYIPGQFTAPLLDFAPWAFSVVDSDCATGNLVFPHELGHNMGARHDRFVDDKAGAFDYSHGFVNPAGFITGDPIDRWRTIMAYNTQCADVGGFYCSRIPYFSNPDVTVNGNATGVAAPDLNSADNALSFENTAVIAANWRSSANCGSPCNDGVDNDADGLIDFPDDPGCVDAGDPSEYEQTFIFILDDFETEALGEFPSNWLDAGRIDPDSTAPNPSAVVVTTTDAFGNPTQAVSILDAFAHSQGIYAVIGINPFVKISVDVRMDQYSDNADSLVSDWGIDATLVQLSGTDPLPFGPSMGVETSSLTRTWTSWVKPSGGAPTFAIDFGTPGTIGAWQNVTLDLDTVNGTMRTRITDIATGSLLLDRSDVLADWTLADGLFNVVGFFDGELTLAATQNNRTVLDNVFVSTVECSDGSDNDADGLIDSDDPGCAGESDLSEKDPLLACDDGADNDGDGHADFPDDVGCQGPDWHTESPECSDGINNDPGQDPDPGLIDFDGGLSALGYVASDPDPQCVGLAWKNRESTGVCGLGGFELALIMPGLMWLRRRLLR